MSFPSPARALAAAFTAVLLAASFLQAPAQAAAPEYVALGDSYSSGTGTRSYLADGSSCQRSTSAYPALLAASRGWTLNFRACSGARIPDVRGTQLSALTSTTRYVTISVGGNDAGFADVLTECALPGWMSSCHRAVDRAQAFINGPLPGRLAGLYASIRSRAPYARVVVVGYPRIFMGEDCNAATFFSPAEQSRLNQTADLMNARTATQAATAGFRFADPTSAFLGHAVCDRAEWINGLSWPVTESYHPSVAGQGSGYTPTVSAQLTGVALRADGALMRASAAGAGALAVRQRKYAAADRTIRPKELTAPDLTTEAARSAAREAGIDLDRWLARH
ncbi:SGNH/GDSL hydrolase family protein [uncultured Nocardioides sp.]|uniref:SGNH/GDSL hydrolase family protein n=1 Tax=uncultured Nocardioides sp. TaxID=198441 RepID=UPI0025D55682|nr:SGNH/GDSL hydrolase family protein [uncultured Nocardioides sp.]